MGFEPQEELREVLRFTSLRSGRLRRAAAAARALPQREEPDGADERCDLQEDRGPDSQGGNPRGPLGRRGVEHPQQRSPLRDPGR